MRSSANAVRSPRAVNIDDLRRLARHRLPQAVFDYVDGGADEELTLAANVSVFRDVTFRPRNGIAIGECDLKTRVLGEEISFPALLAPVGYARLMHPGGEVASARAAGNAGTGFILSSISGHKLEHVKAATKGPSWYQLYLLGGREAAEAAIDRAHRAGFTALVITVDTPIAGMRERDQRNGMKELLSASLFAKLPYLPGILTHPRWLMSFLSDGGVPKLENIVIPGKGPLALVDVATVLAHAVVTWEDLKWIRKMWHEPIVVKGILIGDDARRAVDEGAAAVVVSNHGGRQLDGVSPSLRALPEVVAAVKGQVEVLMDGGIRRGSDIIKAICLGANAVLVGRAYVYGLAAAGEAGVARSLEILKNDLDRTLRLVGCSSIAKLDRSYLDTHRLKNIFND
jgi:isopentenyl diphosphate isomerase/L-lactate dehydrogenase-like FMN-dependent dehydrogenase